MLFFLNPLFGQNLKTLMVTNAGDHAGKYKLVEIEAYLGNRLFSSIKTKNIHYWLLIRNFTFWYLP